MIKIENNFGILEQSAFILKDLTPKVWFIYNSLSIFLMKLY